MGLEGASHEGADLVVVENQGACRMLSTVLDAFRPNLYPKSAYVNADGFPVLGCYVALPEVCATGGSLKHCKCLPITLMEAASHAAQTYSKHLAFRVSCLAFRAYDDAVSVLHILLAYLACSSTEGI